MTLNADGSGKWTFTSDGRTYTKDIPAGSKPGQYGGYVDKYGELHATSSNVPTDSNGWPVTTYRDEQGVGRQTKADYDAQQKAAAEAMAGRGSGYTMTADENEQLLRDLGLL